MSQVSQPRSSYPMDLLSDLRPGTAQKLAPDQKQNSRRCPPCIRQVSKIQQAQLGDRNSKHKKYHRAIDNIRKWRNFGYFEVSYCHAVMLSSLAFELKNKRVPSHCRIAHPGQKVHIVGQLTTNHHLAIHHASTVIHSSLIAMS